MKQYCLRFAISKGRVFGNVAVTQYSIFHSSFK